MLYIALWHLLTRQGNYETCLMHLRFSHFKNKLKECAIHYFVHHHLPQDWSLANLVEMEGELKDL